MNIVCNDCSNQEIVAVNAHQRSVMEFFISSASFEEDMHRRVAYIVNEKYEQCLKKFRAHWESVLKREGAESIPVDDEAFVSMIVAREDYKDKEARDALERR